MWEKEIDEIKNYIGTNTLIRVDINDLRMHEDLFILLEHIYDAVNGEETDPTLIRNQAYNIIRSFYNTYDDDIKELYANLSDSYRPQYVSKLNDKIKDYRILEFSDFKLPIVNLVSNLIESKLTIEVYAISHFQSQKFLNILTYLNSKNLLDTLSDIPSYIIEGYTYYDKTIKDFGKIIDKKYTYNELDDMSYNMYHGK